MIKESLTILSPDDFQLSIEKAWKHQIVHTSSKYLSFNCIFKWGMQVV